MTATDKSAPARYVMIGGFLGAGKSTAVRKLAQRVVDSGGSVGLITNDQGERLVDTALARASGFAVEEVAGGCFCCRFESLTEASERLTKDVRPDVIVAEPVGSCTDLIATVSYPLRRMYGESYRIAPLSVMVDPLRALAILKVGEVRPFSRKVRYIYLKQLEEAEAIIINKCDLVTEAQIAILRGAIEERFTGHKVFEVSARDGTGLDAWFDWLLAAEADASADLDIDYDTYAEGEALLGWLNATLTYAADSALDGDQLLADLAQALCARIAATGGEVAHLKVTMMPEDPCDPSVENCPVGTSGMSTPVSSDMAVVHIARADSEPEVTERLAAPTARGQIIVNLRAEAESETLAAALNESLEDGQQRSGVRINLEHMDHFAPGRPTPVHRMSAPAP